MGFVVSIASLIYGLYPLHEFIIQKFIIRSNKNRSNTFSTIKSAPFRQTYNVFISQLLFLINLSLFFIYLMLTSFSTIPDGTFLDLVTFDIFGFGKSAKLSLILYILDVLLISLIVLKIYRIFNEYKPRIKRANTYYQLYSNPYVNSTNNPQFDKLKEYGDFLIRNNWINEPSAYRALQRNAKARFSTDLGNMIKELRSMNINASKLHQHSGRSNTDYSTRPVMEFFTDSIIKDPNGFIDLIKGSKFYPEIIEIQEKFKLINNRLIEIRDNLENKMLTFHNQLEFLTTPENKIKPMAIINREIYQFLLLVKIEKYEDFIDSNTFKHIENALEDWSKIALID